MVFKIFSALLALYFCVAPARAGELNGRVEAELAAHAAAALPPGAVISIVAMTPVRGHVETVEIVRFDHQTGYFEATVANGAVARRVTGRAQAQIPLYAPVRAIRAGERVAASDFMEMMAPVSHAPADPVENPALIDGFEARRSLAAGRPVSREWLGAPYVVARNDMVTLSYNSEHIRLTARARALEDGAVGDVIRAMQVNGGAVIEGVVSGPKLISVH